MKKVLFAITCVSVVMLAGCGTATKQSPHMGFNGMNMEAQIGREDIVVMDPVEGTSTMTNYLGLVQVIDGDKLQILGIPFFKDKVTYWDKGFFKDTTLNRAYYKALAATPDADVVFYKSFDEEVEGIPLLLGTRTVTVKGKAVKLASDK